MQDVQKSVPEIKLRLTRVGVTGVRKLLSIPRKEKRPIILLASFDCFVDLPSSQKGVHMSRNLEGINEIVEQIIAKPAYESERICEDIAAEVLERHDYATRCEVAMRSKLMLPRMTPKRAVQEFVDIIARAVAQRGEAAKREIGAEVQGIIFHRLGKSGHALRAKARLSVEVPNGFFVSVKDLAEILENSFSARMRASPGEEKMVAKEMEANPKSVEEVVQDALRGAAEKFSSFPDHTLLTASCTAEESIAPYGTFAEKRAALGKIKSAAKRARGKG